jgi:hypothetical protein
VGCWEDTKDHGSTSDRSEISEAPISMGEIKWVQLCSPIMLATVKHVQ